MAIPPIGRPASRDSTSLARDLVVLLLPFLLLAVFWPVIRWVITALLALVG